MCPIREIVREPGARPHRVDQYAPSIFQLRLLFSWSGRDRSGDDSCDYKNWAIRIRIHRMTQILTSFVTFLDVSPGSRKLDGTRARTWMLKVNPAGTTGPRLHNTVPPPLPQGRMELSMNVKPVGR